MSDALLPPPSKIVCVGKNYRDHAKEMGGEAPAEPLLFLKPPSSLIGDGDTIRVPPGAGRVDYEGEIAFQIGAKASHVSEAEALGHLAAVLPLNDVTCRDIQSRDGQWTRAKGFDTFCVAGTPVPIGEVELADLRVRTRVNGELKQDGAFSDVVFSLQALVSYISRVMTLEPGDLIATGTPSGIGPIVPWDEVEVEIPEVGTIRNPVRAGGGRPWPYGVGSALEG